jgi:hypothetical protein
MRNGQEHQSRAEAWLWLLPRILAVRSSGGCPFYAPAPVIITAQDCWAAESARAVEKAAAEICRIHNLNADLSLNWFFFGLIFCG